MKKPSLKISGITTRYKENRRKRKDKEAQERSLESSTLKIITFIVTLVAMTLGMSFLPLFPQPLPIFIAFLVAFVTYMKPRFGMPIGGIVIGLGLLFHMAELYFFSFLGDMMVRVAVVAVWLVLFTVLPIFINRYKSALAIDLGILAATLLFFESTYFLAIPLLLASIVFFRKNAALSIVYYVLIVAPLMIVQYFKYTVDVIVRTEWWLEPGSSPPIFVSLNQIFGELTASMSQFRLYDTAQVIYSITGQLTWEPNFSGRTLTDALIQYRDSVPGILLFVVIVAGLAAAIIFFTSVLVKEGLIGSGDKFFPCFTATIAAALFFVLLSALQRPLAFTADVNAVTMVLGVLSTFLLTLPVLFIDYTPKKRATDLELTEKAQGLMNKLLAFEAQLGIVKENIPVDASSPEGKMLVLKDSLEDILKKAQGHVYEQLELDKKFAELDKLDKDLDDLELELNTLLSEYQIFAACEFSNWLGKLKDSGLDLKSTVNAEFQKELPLEQRIEAIRQVLDGGRFLAKEVAAVAEPVYGVIRPLYDPSLPAQSRAVEFTMTKLDGKEAPWIAIEALYSSLNNWKRQYGNDILASMKYLQNSIKPIANLSIQEEVLPSVFGDEYLKVLDYAKKAEAMAFSISTEAEKDQIDITDVVSLKDNVESFLAISNDVLSMLYSGLIAQEKAIEDLLPTKDYLWEKNDTLHERLKTATQTLANASNLKINQVMEQLPRYLSYMDETVQTLALYSERKEFLLNYPLAEAAIEERLKEKEKLTPKDLPFNPRFAAEYLRLYYTPRYGEYAFDKDTFVLTKRP